MTLKYNCSSCGQILYTSFLKPGERALCRNCGAFVVVPEDAAIADCLSDIGRMASQKSEDEPPKPPVPEPVPIVIQQTAVVMPAPQPKEPNYRYPGFWQASGLLTIFLVLVIFLTIPLVCASIKTGSKFYANPYVGEVVMALGYVAIFYLGIRITRLPFKEIYPFTPIATKLVVPVVIATIGSVIVLSEIDNIFSLVMPMPDLFKTLFRKIFDNFWFFLIGGVIVAPITEEMLFRGVILRGFLNRYSNLKAIILSALLFGLFHLNPWQFISAFFLGMLFAWWFIKTRSLIICVLGHAIANGVVSVADLVNLKIRGFNWSLEETTAFQPLWFDLLGVALVVFGIWLFKRMTENHRPGATA